MNAIIQDIMRPFGVTPRYAGFPMLVASVELYLEDPNRLSAVIDEIYKPAAKRCRCTSDNVEHPHHHPAGLAEGPCQAPGNGRLYALYLPQGL